MSNYPSVPTRTSVLRAQGAGTWLEEKYTTKTVNNRAQTLWHMYRVLGRLEGADAGRRCGAAAGAPSAKVLVPAKTFRLVAANLTDAKTRARFQVIASTGVRPGELKRAEPADVDLDRRVWIVRTAKGRRAAGVLAQ